ncbi:hypothetical protein [Acinetobacter sp. Marseille-Q1623]|uniref:hypothetical protein n=1 Tax=Acinetobacter sp. Marseille-Q1623 TaxID=2697501 RepID=UPI001E5BD915|nr:hypothetical protein [Acinetobacter sp. Marseille-Q1623]
MATRLYNRFRRVSGRVIDVRYLIENKEYAEYAEYVVQQALVTNDLELKEISEQLSKLIYLEITPVKNSEDELYDRYAAEVTEEEIYKAQVPHHYIGALR